MGTFVLSGIAFLMLFLQKGVHSSDIVAHWALFAGLVFTPLAIFSGISASPNGPEGNVMLFNKFLLSCAAIGLSVGLLWNRYQNQSIHMNRVHALLGMVTVCLILITASFGACTPGGIIDAFSAKRCCVCVSGVGECYLTHHGPDYGREISRRASMMVYLDPLYQL